MFLEHVVHGTMTVDMGIPTRHKGATTRCTNRVLCKGIAVGHGIRGDQSIKVRRQRRGVVLVTEHIATIGIWNKQNDIGPLSHTHRCSLSFNLQIIDRTELDYTSAKFQPSSHKKNRTVL